jgi:hypothetical protein
VTFICLFVCLFVLQGESSESALESINCQEMRERKNLQLLRLQIAHNKLHYDQCQVLEELRLIQLTPSELLLEEIFHLFFIGTDFLMGWVFEVMSSHIVSHMCSQIIVHFSVPDISDHMLQEYQACHFSFATFLIIINHKF